MIGGVPISPASQKPANGATATPSFPNLPIHHHQHDSAPGDPENRRDYRGWFSENRSVDEGRSEPENRPFYPTDPLTQSFERVFHGRTLRF